MEKAWGSLISDISAVPPTLDTDLLVRADALDFARTLPDDCLSLIYLDPPFGVGKNHRALKGRNGRFRLHGQIAYSDPTHPPLSAAGNDGGQEGPEAAGLPAWLSPLLEESRRILRPGGAVFLHLDYRSAHRARSLLDEVFGEECFQNEIIWHYATGGIPTRWLARKHDTILYYRSGSGHVFHRLTEKKYLAHRMSRRGVEEFQDERGWYRFRSLDDVWEIPWLTQDAKERTGYPTQKPEALLRRILEIATNPGDRVADFCCGSGTTSVAARSLGRRWVACDRSELALRIAAERLDAAGAEG